MAMATPIPKHQNPRCAKATANSCLLSGTRIATTNAITPTTTTSTELETTSTPYSDGVGFLDGNKNGHIIVVPRPSVSRLWENVDSRHWIVCGLILANALAAWRFRFVSGLSRAFSNRG